MIFCKILRKGNLLFLSFLISIFVSSCSSVGQRQGWVLEKAITPYAIYDASRIFLPVDDQFRGLEVVYVRGSQGVCMFINACSIPFPTDDTCPDKTDVVVEIADSFYVVRADRLKGGQRLLMPCDITENIVEALLVGCPVYITIGRYCGELIPDNFEKVYRELNQMHCE